MLNTFTLRPITADDGEAVRHLMEDDPITGGMQFTTKFLVDPVTAWRALKPDMVGAVAVDGEGRILGTATVSFDEVQYNGRVLPLAFLENLKVHHAARGQGIGTALAKWRIGQARARFGGDGVIATGTTADNIASQNTMKKWAAQFFSPITLSIRPALRREPAAPAGLSARRATEADYAQFAENSNRFYAGYQLYPPMSPAWLKRYIDATPNVYGVYVVEDAAGEAVAGAMVSLRAALMVDVARNVPPLLQFVGSRVLTLIPPDGRLTTLEVNYVWYDRLDAARYLWRYLRWAYRDHAASANANFDPRGSLADVFQVKRWHIPKMSLVVALRGPETMDTSKPVCGTLRG